MRKMLIGIVLALGLFVLGCPSTPPAEDGPGIMVGNDSDAHGCKASAGYTWCEELQKCIRSWEENCTAPLVGGDRDEHGCIPSAGYSWCEATQKCYRSWEENCTETAQLANPASVNCINNNGTLNIVNTGEGEVGMCTLPSGEVCEEWAFMRGECPSKNLTAQAQGYCGKENVANVSLCGEYIHVVSSLDGGGSTFYKDGTEIRCPVVSPTSMSAECQMLVMGNNCVEQEIC